MDEIEIERVGDSDLDDPALIEGLPGVGHVGKLAAEHLLEEFDGELVRRVYSQEFPPQVSVDEDGVAELTCAEFYAVTIPPASERDAEAADADAEADDDSVETGADDDDDSLEADGDGESESEGEETDLLVLTGDHQAQSNAGHYRLTEAFLNVAEEFGATRAFSLGGVPTGELVEEHDVLGAVTDAAMVEGLADAGVAFREDEPAGGIVGVSGLVLGLGGRRGFEAACLMGETSGYLVDPKSARAVLEVLQTVIDVEVDFERLEERAEEMEEVAGKIQEMQNQQSGMPSEDELRYIG